MGLDQCKIDIIKQIFRNIHIQNIEQKLLSSRKHWTKYTIPN